MFSHGLDTSKLDLVCFGEVAFLEFFENEISHDFSWVFVPCFQHPFSSPCWIKTTSNHFTPMDTKVNLESTGQSELHLSEAGDCSKNVSVGVKLLCFASTIDWFTTHYYICVLLLSGQLPFEAQKCILFLCRTSAPKCSNAQWVQLRVCRKVN